LSVEPVAFALEIANEASKSKVTLESGKPVVTLRGGNASRPSGWLDWGQVTMRDMARVHV
jgi:hypothetical protein